jgi:protein-tyrosine-phosphatase
MAANHKAVLQEDNPALAERILTIRELAGGSGDFDDPVGGSTDVYRQAAEELERIITDSYGHIIALIEQHG